MNKRKICVVTATRAEYGLLKNLLDELKSDSAIDLQLAVTGTHLSSEFGNTYQHIISDGFHIDKKVEILSSSDTAVEISKSMGRALIGFADVFNELKPDLLVVLGDRFELIPIVSAANIANIPVAHLNGGELTEGSKDETFRHAITKLSHLHFTSLQAYANRVIQMGESPNRVFNVGAIGLDGIRNSLLNKESLETALGISFLQKNLLITYHPDTNDTLEFSENAVNNLLGELARLKDTRLIFTKANADLGGRAINKLIEDFVKDNSNTAILFDSLGRLRYLSCLQFVDAIVGNSSSGIYEAACFKIGTINIGDRQKGRVRGNNVIDTSATPRDLQSAFNKLYSADFKGLLKDFINPYGEGKACKKIADILKNHDLSSLNKKLFFDIQHNA